MKPAFAAMAILNGMNAWNNYLWPLLVIRSSEKYTLTLGLNTLINPYGDNYSLLVVGSFFSIVPIFILFVCFQKYFHRRYDSRRCERVTRESTSLPDFHKSVYNYPIVHDLF